MSDSRLPWQSDNLDQEEEFLRLVSTAKGLAAGDADNRIAYQTGDKLDKYLLVEPLGKGGMGTVWLAKQVEGVERFVALKLISPGLSTPELITRFVAERQALALLDHQNVAKVFDVGESETGSPYFVMELVEGESLIQFCDSNQLSIRERLALFVSVCRAVQYAHERGIIHRDLKPANIIVTKQDETPIPKIIDFGLAKAIGQSEGIQALSFQTEIGTVVGTLEYMSPEQAEINSINVDERADVYSLGVILFELLTAKTPVDSETIANNELLDNLNLIRDLQVVRPSHKLSQTAPNVEATCRNRKTTSRALFGLLRRELDWVTLRALAKEKELRYSSAAELADDVQRFLDGRPTSAGPPGFLKSFNTVVKKQKLKICVAVLVGICLWIGLFFGNLNSQTKTDEQLLFTKSPLAEAELRSRALDRYILDQKEAGVDPDFSPIGDSDCFGQINLSGSQLQGIRVAYGTKLQNMCFVEADLSNSILSDCRFGKSVFKNANLSAASLNGSDFTGAIFDHANMRNCNLHNANFEKARLRDADLTGARLESACLGGVTDWSEADLMDANLEKAVVDSLDWIERVRPLLKNPSCLDSWLVKPIPANVVLPDTRYAKYKFWIRSAK